MLPSTKPAPRGTNQGGSCTRCSNGRVPGYSSQVSLSSTAVKDTASPASDVLYFKGPAQSATQVCELREQSTFNQQRERTRVTLPPQTRKGLGRVHDGRQASGERTSLVRRSVALQWRTSH